MQIIFDNNPDKTVEGIYLAVKNAYMADKLNRSHVHALAELFTELDNRLKEEKGCGE